MDNPTKGFQAKRCESGDFVEYPIEAFEDDLGIDIFDEEDEDEVLDECFAKVARDRDLSPRQQRKGFKKKKTHEKKYNWDGKVSEEVQTKLRQASTVKNHSNSELRLAKQEDPDRIPKDPPPPRTDNRENKRTRTGIQQEWMELKSDRGLYEGFALPQLRSTPAMIERQGNTS
ncbi:hypothetical protein BC332_15836 [Capsicum chinense]|nr:hypothetical protein BC332_15836 [Capsicum chinense]